MQRELSEGLLGGVVALAGRAKPATERIIARGMLTAMQALNSWCRQLYRRRRRLSSKPQTLLLMCVLGLACLALLARRLMARSLPADACPGPRTLGWLPCNE